MITARARVAFGTFNFVDVSTDTTNVNANKLKLNCCNGRHNHVNQSIDFQEGDIQWLSKPGININDKENFDLSYGSIKLGNQSTDFQDDIQSADDIQWSNKPSVSINNEKSFDLSYRAIDEHEYSTCPKSQWGSRYSPDDIETHSNASINSLDEPLEETNTTLGPVDLEIRVKRIYLAPDLRISLLRDG